MVWYLVVEVRLCVICYVEMWVGVYFFVHKRKCQNIVTYCNGSVFKSDQG